MTSTKKREGVVVTPEFRGSFVKLRKPESVEGGTAKFSMTCPIPVEGNENFFEELEAAIEAAALKRWDSVPKKLKHPIRDYDEDEDENYPEFIGTCRFVPKSEERPRVIDVHGDPVDMADVYSGAWYRVSIRAYAWQHPTSGKGVSFNLDNVLKIRDDEPFGGRGRAEDDFSTLLEKKSSRGRGKGDESDEGEGDEDKPRTRRTRRGKTNPLA